MPLTNPVDKDSVDTDHLKLLSTTVQDLSGSCSSKAAASKSDLDSSSDTLSASSLKHENNSTVQNVVDDFGEFLANFKDDEEKEKCEILARNLINSGENVIDVSITDIKSHSKSLMNSINAL